MISGIDNCIKHLRQFGSRIAFVVIKTIAALVSIPAKQSKNFLQKQKGILKPHRYIYMQSGRVFGLHYVSIDREGTFSAKVKRKILRVQKLLSHLLEYRIGNKLSPLRRYYFTELLVILILVGSVGVYMTSQGAATRSKLPIPYQGRLMDQNYVPKADGTYYLAFEIYDALTSGTCKWRTEVGGTGACDGSDLEAITTTVSRGLFNVVLGDGTANVNPQMAENFNTANTAYYLQVRVCTSAAATSCETLSPRKQLGGVLFSYNSDLLDGVDSTGVLLLSPGTSTQSLTFTDAATTALTLTANSLTSGTALSISASALTSGTGITFTGPTSTGITGSALSITSDVGSGGELINLVPDFSGAAVTAYGISMAGTDSTSSGNTNYLNYGSLTYTGNAAKVGIGYYTTLSTSSTTADTLIGFDMAAATTGIITTGTRNIYGIRSQPASTAASTGGTTNVYGGYFKAAGVVGTSGTINSYGLYIANGTMDTTGTSTNYGLYVESPTLADTNYAAIFAGGNVGIGTTAPATPLEIVFSSSATSTVTTANSIKIRNSDTTVNNGAFVLFDIQRSTPGQINAGAIGGTSSADTNNGHLVFYTNSTGTLSERLRIDQNGYVGIGSSSPSYRLDIVTSTANDRGINIAHSATSGTNYGIYTSLTGAATTNVGGYFSATGATNNYAAIFENGSIGIGTTAPFEKLTIMNGSFGLTQGYINTPSGGFGTYQNLLTYSEEFNNSAWVTSSVTVTTDSTAGPDGRTIADTLEGTGSSNIKQTYTTTTNGNYTFSVWMKTSSGTVTTGLRIDSTDATPTTGTVSAVTVTTTWQRFSVTQNFTGTPSNISAVILPGNGSTGTVIAWGAQLEQASSANLYVRTLENAIATTQRGATVNGNLFINGPLTAQTKTVTSASYTLTDFDNTVFVNSSTSTTITLPAASSSTIGRMYEVYKADGGSTSVTVQRAGSDQVNGGTSVSVSTQWYGIRVIGYTATQWIARTLTSP
ncbi:hypothetical protein HY620_02100 [Candidatus Uhrbacteria bacterium]|nr:hypothetical protein [Candidatus Uhrbacteria bacterium]